MHIVYESYAYFGSRVFSMASMAGMASMASMAILSSKTSYRWKLFHSKNTIIIWNICMYVMYAWFYTFQRKREQWGNDYFQIFCFILSLNISDISSPSSISMLIRDIVTRIRESVINLMRKLQHEIKYKWPALCCCCCYILHARVRHATKNVWNRYYVNEIINN